MSEYRRDSRSNGRKSDRQSRSRERQAPQRNVISLESARNKMQRSQLSGPKWTDDDFAQFSGAGRLPREPRRDTGRLSTQRRPAQRKTARPKKKPQTAARKRLKIILLVSGILLLALITALLCIFLVFKVENIRVEGDIVYAEQDILNICDYEYGDNLFFLSTADREIMLEERLPYIKEATIRREIPNTIVIEIVGAAVVSNVQVNDTYLYMSGEAKILEIAAEPMAGIMMVQGLEVQTPVAGEKISVVNKEAEEAYTAISLQTDESQAQTEFTKLDLTDIHDIRMWYQDRIEMKLGSASWLDYKIRFGLRIVREQTEVITADARGVLDLSLSKEENKAPFAQDYSQMPAETTPEESAEADPNTPPAFADNPGRGDDIPDYPYGYTPPESEDSDENSGGETEGGTDENTGGDEDGYSDNGNGEETDEGNSDE